MNNIDRIYNESKDIKDYSKNYLLYMGELLNSLDAQGLEDFLTEIESVRKTGNTIFIAGNGGSASTASHIAMDLSQVFYKIPSFNPPFKAISLADNTSTVTAIGNDFGYEEVFTKQLKNLYKDGDILIVISVSGNSANVLMAVEWVKSVGGKTVGFLGFDGGKLKDICDLSILVKTPKGEYGPVEDVHLILNHLFFNWFYNKYRDGRAE